jgi:UDP-GlcNAc:undecaprenyl-phosphate GlcNAc-1-phosphate transferase
VTDTLVLVVMLALALGLAFTAAARSLAHRVGLVDKPDGRRKVQSRPVAVVGGVALFATVVSALLVGRWVNPTLAAVLDAEPRQTLWLLSACALILLVGVVDDLKNLRARFKLVGQITAALLAVVGGGFVVERVTVFGLTLEFGMFAIPLTVLWFLAAMNAINLLDGMDGMLGTLGVVICGSVGVMATLGGHGLPAVVAFALTGGLLAFLYFNKPPASVYMGDAGSLLIGLVVAALSIKCALKGPAVAILAPVGLLTLPFLDTSAAIVRRKLTGRGLAVADRGHLHHLLQKRGWSIRRSLFVVGGLGVVAAAGAILSLYFFNDFMAVVAAVAVVVVLLVRGLFGVAEARLLAKRAVTVFSSTVTRPTNDYELEVRLQGTAEWEGMWKEITGRAEELQLTAVYLDVNVPFWQEGYHRRWEKRTHEPDHLTGWRVDLPLVGHGQVIGRVTVFGDRGESCIGDKLSELSVLARKAEQLAFVATLPYVRAAGRPPHPAAAPPAAPVQPVAQSV